ncbi:MAG: hypothetical protein JSW44_01320 [Candidatus Bathyarchaeota archaeon]|nr:MAG: hypothetical protein JSW44_01320 [Candidatus Bathyarchaeota archaeon]
MRLRKCAMKLKQIMAAGGAHCDGGFVFWILGLLFAVFGVVSDAKNIAILSLESTSWFLLSIVFCLSGIASWIGWGLAVLLKAIETKSKKE